jgi:serine phosphatase RsbU (regulator of sigma subunit)
MQMILQDAATLSAADIIQRFVARGEAWANGKAQDDDVTFVVLKVR